MHLLAIFSWLRYSQSGRILCRRCTQSFPLLWPQSDQRTCLSLIRFPPESSVDSEVAAAGMEKEARRHPCSHVLRRLSLVLLSVRKGNLSGLKHKRWRAFSDKHTTGLCSHTENTYYPQQVFPNT